jgi:hypothetical protein
MFQKMSFDTLWAPSSGNRNGLGMTQIDLSAMFVLPLPMPDLPLMITPSFQTTFFDPKINDYATNKTLYKTGFNFRWIRPIVRNKLTLSLGVAVQYRGDFRVKESEALQFPANITFIWNCNSCWKIIWGAAYLDKKDDYNWLPLVGLIWIPHEEINVELVVPRIRIAKRVHWFSSAADNATADWIYAALELVGGSWSYEYQNFADNINYHDLKLLLGFERRCVSGFTFGFEFGYIFERKYELNRLNYNTHPADTAFLRVRISF